MAFPGERGSGPGPFPLWGKRPVAGFGEEDFLQRQEKRDSGRSVPLERRRKGRDLLPEETAPGGMSPVRFSDPLVTGGRNFMVLPLGGKTPPAKIILLPPGVSFCRKNFSFWSQNAFFTATPFLAGPPPKRRTGHYFFSGKISPEPHILWRKKAGIRHPHQIWGKKAFQPASRADSALIQGVINALNILPFHTFNLVFHRFFPVFHPNSSAFSAGRSHFVQIFHQIHHLHFYFSTLSTDLLTKLISLEWVLLLLMHPFFSLAYNEMKPPWREAPSRAAEKEDEG